MVEELLQRIKTAYGIEPEDVFGDPDIAVFRHTDNRKWFGVLMRIPLCKLGLPAEENGMILNLKAEPLFIDSIVDHQRIFRAYHMNKEHWISVLLDGSVSMDDLGFFIEGSYQLTKKRNKK